MLYSASLPSGFVVQGHILSKWIFWFNRETYQSRRTLSHMSCIHSTWHMSTPTQTVRGGSRQAFRQHGVRAQLDCHTQSKPNETMLIQTSPAVSKDSTLILHSTSLKSCFFLSPSSLLSFLPILFLFSTKKNESK